MADLTAVDIAALRIALSNVEYVAARQLGPDHDW